MAGTITFKIQGLDALRESLSGKRIEKDIANGLGLASKQFTSTLRGELVKRYKISPSRFNNALKKQSISTETTGRNLIKFGIEIEDIPLSLSRFVTDKYRGNIPPVERKRRKGLVHVVTIKRGQPKISYGRYRQGGFTAKKGRVMLERVRPGRDSPLKVMYGPNIVDMSEWLMDYNTTVQRAFLNISDVVFESINL